MTVLSPLERPSEIPNSSLAFLGDAMYELLLRHWLLTRSRAKSGALHHKGIRFSRASTQAVLAQLLLQRHRLSKEEESVLLRGRNSNPGTMAKHASPMEYRWATALETWVGYCVARGQLDRIQECLIPLWEEWEIDGEQLLRGGQPLTLENDSRGKEECNEEDTARRTL